MVSLNGKWLKMRGIGMEHHVWKTSSGQKAAYAIFMDQ
jgi:hypothetical protein